MEESPMATDSLKTNRIWRNLKHYKPLNPDDKLLPPPSFSRAHTLVYV
jgi:hypothetical protein